MPYGYRVVMLAGIVTFITMYHTGVLMEILLLASYVFVSFPTMHTRMSTDRPRLPVLSRKQHLL